MIQINAPYIPERVRAPEHIWAAHSEPAHRMLQTLDPELELRFNAKLKRFEVWNRGGFVRRITGRDGTGFREPGEWLVNELRAIHPAHRPLDEIVQHYRKEVDGANKRLEAAVDEKRRADVEAMTHDKDWRAGFKARLTRDWSHFPKRFGWHR